MTQYMRPQGVPTVVGWAGSAADVADASGVDDGTYAESPPSPTSASYWECDLNGVTSPGVTTGHILRFRDSANMAGGDQGVVCVEVRRKSDNVLVVSHQAVVQYPSGEASMELSSAQAALIQSYASSALKVRVYATAAVAQAGVIRSEPFATVGVNNRYGFDNKFPTNPLVAQGISESWWWTHLPTGGPNGDPCIEMGCYGTAGNEQFNWGFQWTSLQHSFSLGDRLYIRYRIRYTDAPVTSRNKFVILGNAATDPISRMIVFQICPRDNWNCTLDAAATWWESVLTGAQTEPADYGLPYTSWDDPAIDDVYAAECCTLNVEGNGIGPVLTAAAGAPLMPTTGWLHVQYEITSGAAGTATMKVWRNNNVYAAPSVSGTGYSIGVENWNDGVVSVGAYMDDSNGPLTFRLQDLEFATSFDASWYPGI